MLARPLPVGHAAGAHLRVRAARLSALRRRDADYRLRDRWCVGTPHTRPHRRTHRSPAAANRILQTFGYQFLNVHLELYSGHPDVVRKPQDSAALVLYSRSNRTNFFHGPLYMRWVRDFEHNWVSNRECRGFCRFLPFLRRLSMELHTPGSNHGFSPASAQA